MEPITELKCACANCGATIDYRADAAGQIVECPECKEKSRLPEGSSVKMTPANELPPVAPPRLCPACGANMAPYGSACKTCESRRRRNLGLIVGVASAVIVLGVGWLFLRRFYSPPRKTQPAGYMFLDQPHLKTPKSMRDFKISPFWLESKRGSDLTVAVGDISNASLNVYLHLTANADLLDARGAKIGSVTDNINELLPEKTWRFLATVKDPRAKSVRFAGLKEIP